MFKSTITCNLVGYAEYTTYETDDGQKRKQLRVNVNNFVLPEKREQSEEAKLETATIPF